MQIAELEKHFVRTPYLTLEFRKEVPKKLGIDEKRIKIWFQTEESIEKG